MHHHHIRRLALKAAIPELSRGPSTYIGIKLILSQHLLDVIFEPFFVQVKLYLLPVLRFGNAVFVDGCVCFTGQSGL